MEKSENKLNVSSQKVFSGSKPPEFYGEGYFLRAEGSNYGRKTAEGKELFSPYDEQSYLPNNRRLASMICNMYKPKTVMVLGCARGYLVQAFRELKVDVVGVDISSWAVEHCPERMREFLYVGDICDLSLFQDKTFDVIVALDVFEHVTVPDLYKALDEAVRISKDVVFIDVPTEKDDLHPDQSSGTDKSHVSVYSAEWWVHQFVKRGFDLDGMDVYRYPEGNTGATEIFRRIRKLPVENAEEYGKKYPHVKGITKDEAGAEQVELDKRPAVDIILLNYNGLSFTPHCIEALYHNTSYPFNLIVVDNQSTDGSEVWLADCARTYGYKVHFNEELDSGYAAGVNIGLKHSDAPYVCLLNNDIIITQKDWLDKLVEALEKSPERGIVTPMLVYPDKRVQYAGASFDEKLNPLHIGRFKKPEEFLVEREIPTATFACVLMRGSLARRGLDEAYKLGTFEDTDFCVNARFDGYSIWYCPQVRLYHYEGATTFKRDMTYFNAVQQVNAALFHQRWDAWLTFNRKAYPEVYA